MNRQQHKDIDLIFCPLFSATTYFDYLHQLSSRRHQVTKRIKRGEASSNKQRCELLSDCDNNYSDSSIIILEVVLEVSGV